MKPTGAGDLERANPNYRTVIDPYSGEPVVVVPAVEPGCRHRARPAGRRDGNAHIWGIIGEQKEAAFAAGKVILTAEEIVDEQVIRSDPNRTLIPGFIVDAVCHVPYCAHPSYTQGYYDRDNAFYLEWDQISKTRAGVQAYLDEWVYGVKDRQEYWQKLGAEVHKRVSKVGSLPSEVGQLREILELAANSTSRAIRGRL